MPARVDGFQIKLMGVLRASTGLTVGGKRVLYTYAQRRPFRALLLCFVMIILVDFSADDGCSCGDITGRTVAMVRAR